VNRHEYDEWNSEHAKIDAAGQGRYRTYTGLAWFSALIGVALGISQGEGATALLLFGLLMAILGVGGHTAKLLMMTYDVHMKYMGHRILNEQKADSHETV
jgi:hypothetical protein